MEKKQKKIKGKKKLFIIAAVIVGLLLIFCLCAFLYVNSMLDKVNFSKDNNNIISNTNNHTDGNTEYMQSNHIYNILLIGCDARDNTNSGRSDSMILISINKNTKKIIMTSIMRDIYLPIPGYGNNRINAAYSYGNASLLLNTIEENFKIKIDKFVSVNFFSFIDIIDDLGGVTVDISKDELPVVNRYVRQINSLEKLPSNDGLLQSAGNGLKLTGKQVLGFSRIRYVGNADFDRTKRQREILTQIVNKLKGQSILELNHILNTLLPNITTDLNKTELYSFILSFPTYATYDIEQVRIPIDNSFQFSTINHMSVLSIDFNKNIAALKSKIYG